MVLVGLLLVLAAVATAAVAADAVRGEVLTAEGAVAEAGSVPAVGLLLLGAACGALALLGLVAMLSGGRRRRSKRREARHAAQERAERAERADELAKENEKLQAELEERSRSSLVDPYPEDARHRDAVRADVTAGDASDPAYERPEDPDRDWRRR